MRQNGFSIRCPHCFEWTDWASAAPSDYLIRSHEEWLEALNSLSSSPGGVDHPKLLQCEQRFGACPAPFQGFICLDHVTAHTYAQQAPSWATRRAFRLCKLDHFTRFNDPAYCGVLFSTRPVPRQRHIELERLIDNDFLSRTIAGIGLEINAPVTVYAATCNESTNSNYWLPIEAYDHSNFPIPSRYIDFCAGARRAFLSPIAKDFDNQMSPSSCAHRNPQSCPFPPSRAPCTHSPRDWNRCPAFLERRRVHCCCYESDTKLITEVEKQWTSGDLTAATCILLPCWAGYTEIAAPIIIHDHLVAIAMTGQFLTTESPLPRFEELVKARPMLRAFANQLSPLRDGPGETVLDARRVTEEELRHIQDTLLLNCRRIADAATAKYQNTRFRSESIFRQELLGRIDQSLDRSESPERLVPMLLSRMRDFWAFSSVALFVWIRATTQLRILSSVGPDGAEKTYANGVGAAVGLIPHRDSPTVPTPLKSEIIDSFLHPSAWSTQFVAHLASHLHENPIAPFKSPVCMIAFAPFTDKVYALVFISRRQDSVSPLRRARGAEISPLCQQTVLDTTVETLRSLQLLRTTQRLQHNISTLTRGAMAISIVHDTTGPLTNARDIARVVMCDPSSGLSAGVLESLNQIRGICDSGISSINQVREFCSAGRITREPCDINSVLRCCHNALTGKFAQKRIKVLFDPTCLPEVTVDAHLIGLVFRNLLENAVKFLAPDCHLEIHTRALPGRVAIEFCDDGSGIPEHVIDRLESTDLVTCAPNGTHGQGLQICKAITVDLHQGTITFTSPPVYSVLRGTCIRIELST